MVKFWRQNPKVKSPAGVRQGTLFLLCVYSLRLIRERLKYCVIRFIIFIHVFFKGAHFVFKGRHHFIEYFWV